MIKKIFLIIFFMLQRSDEAEALDVGCREGEAEPPLRKQIFGWTCPTNITACMFNNEVV